MKTPLMILLACRKFVTQRSRHDKNKNTEATKPPSPAVEERRGQEQQKQTGPERESQSGDGSQARLTVELGA
jgi:hypothetical protein